MYRSIKGKLEAQEMFWSTPVSRVIHPATLAGVLHTAIGPTSVAGQLAVRSTSPEVILDHVLQ
jgi:hypothetical protein